MTHILDQWVKRNNNKTKIEIDEHINTIYNIYAP